MTCLKKKSVVTPFKSKSGSEEVKRMNKMMTTVIAFGAGMAAYNVAQRNNLMSARNMKRVQRTIKRAIF
jgi:Protein of unknown function (DUF3918)